MSAGFLQEVFLTDEDRVRCYSSLSKLTRHLEEPIIVTGGIAASWHLLRSGIRRKIQLNDIDLVVEGLSSLRTSLSEDFLVRHFHPSRERGKILIMLVDEEFSTRIDIFTPGANTLVKRLTDSAIGEVPCRFVAAEDLSAKLLSIIYPVTRGKPVEPKYVEQFKLLSTVVNLDMMREVWREYRQGSQPTDFEEAAEAVELSITNNPALLQAGEYSQDINQVCRWCCESEQFPCAPLPKIHEILGYV